MAILSDYHAGYASKPDEEIKHRMRARHQELAQVVGQVKFSPHRSPLQAAILGCGDSRLVFAFPGMFRAVTGRTTRIAVFDINIEHLAQSRGNVRQHDCRLPLPDAPYDIIYSHALLKFVGPVDQWKVLENSYNCLGSGGIAIHILSERDSDSGADHAADGTWLVSLVEICETLKNKNIRYAIIDLPQNHGSSKKYRALVLVRGLIKK